MNYSFHDLILLLHKAETELRRLKKCYEKNKNPETLVSIAEINSQIEFYYKKIDEL